MTFRPYMFPGDVGRTFSVEISRTCDVFTTLAGEEARTMSTRNSVRRYKHSYALDKKQDYEAVTAFFESVKGRKHSFLYKDWSDYTSRELPKDPITPTDQFIGVGDGSTLSFRIIKTYVSGLYSYVRAIQRPNASTLVVALDGVPVAFGDYTISNGNIVFLAAPSSGVQITAGYEYFTEVRFEQEQLDRNLPVPEKFKTINVSLVEVPVLSPLPPDVDPTPGAFVWEDVFADYSTWAGGGGADWTGWGTTSTQPAQPALEFFFGTVLPTLQPIGAIVELESPTGTMHLSTRFRIPHNGIIRNFKIDLKDTIVERSKGTNTYWGLFLAWGEIGVQELASPPSVGVSASVGATSITLKDDADTTAFLSTVGPGSICELRTNSTLPNYHPPESRQTLFIQSIVGRVLNLSRPLEISSPVSNPLTGTETSDPSTVTPVIGTLLTANADHDATVINVVNTNNLEVGDWIEISTSELPRPGKNQFSATWWAGLNTSTYPESVSDNYGTIGMNIEFNQVIAKTSNTITLRYGLSKNKLIAWQAAWVKVLPVEGMEIVGGYWEGGQDNGVNLGPQDTPGRAQAWEHQYVWGRYCINSAVRSAHFDTLGRAGNLRRMGQCVRFDTGYNNLITQCIIERGGYSDIGIGSDPGEGYGVSMRLGERFTTASYNTITNCRHGVEFWSACGGCVAEHNTVINGSSSDLDTHGSWNKGITIRNNTLTNNGLLLSPDIGSGSFPDAIRIGNPKFIADEDITVLNNTVTNYKGQAVTIIPGSRKVVVDGIDADNVHRVVMINNNHRHPNLFADDIVFRNFTADTVTDRFIQLNNTTATKVGNNIRFEDWVIGASGTTLVIGPEADEQFIVAYRVDNLQFTRFDINNAVTRTNQYVVDVRYCAGVTFDTVDIQGGYRALSMRGNSGIAGSLSVSGQTSATVFTDGTAAGSAIPNTSGSLTIDITGYTGTVDKTGSFPAVTLI